MRRLRAETEIAGYEDAPWEVTSYLDELWKATGCAGLGYSLEDAARFMEGYDPDLKEQVDDLAAFGDEAALDALWEASRDAGEPDFIAEYIGTRSTRSMTPRTSMIVGIVTLLIASAVQAVGVDIAGPLSPDGLYHLISIAGVPFPHLVGMRLRMA